MATTSTPNTIDEAREKHIDHLVEALNDLRRLQRENPAAFGPDITRFHRGLRGLNQVIATISAGDFVKTTYTPATGIRRDPKTGIVTEVRPNHPDVDDATGIRVVE